MFLISIGTDRKIFEEGSLVRKRQVEYGELFDATHIIVWNEKKKGAYQNMSIRDNVFLYPTNSKNKLFYILDTFRIINFILKKAGKQKKDFVLTTQDPFEVGMIGVISKIIFGTGLHVQLHTDFNNKYFIKHSLLNLVRFFIAQMVLPFADSVRCVSLKAAEGIREMNPNISILPIQQEFKFSDIYERNEFRGRLLTVCRLEREKDLETAMAAFSMLHKDFKDATFTIVGEGSQRKKIESLSHSLGLTKKTNFVGWSNNVADFYKNADIYISTSLFEGYGISMVEAGLSRLPMVLSDAGIAREVFGGRGAFIVEPKDTDNFYLYLKKLFEDSSLVKKMAEESYMSAKSKLINHDKYLELYKTSIEDAYTFKINKSFFVRLISFFTCVINSNRTIRFIISGGSVALSQILILYLLTEIFGVWYLFSSMFSFVYAVVASFILQKYWAFRDNSKDRAFVQFLKFILVAIIGIFINTSSMYFWVDVVGIWYVASQFITGFIIAVINFLIYKFFIFNK